VLRIVLQLLIALALIAQGGVAAAAPLAPASGKHPCGATMHHDRQTPKCPCCPRTSIDMHCGDLCMTLAALPSPPVQLAVRLAATPLRFVPGAVVATTIDTPLRPPIA
jgi:hypothetical protein